MENTHSDPGQFESSNELLNEALRLAFRGWPILPLHSATSTGTCTCGKTDCSSPGKHPRTAHGLKDATTEQAVINRWWEKWPDANVGVCTGTKARILVLDVDPKHGGEVSLDALVKEHGAFPATVEVKTGSGGAHYYFALPSGSNLRNAAGLAGLSGLDIRAEGGYVVAPPSSHISGGSYSWVNSPDALSPATLPDWLFELVKGKKVVDPPVSAPDGEQPIPTGSRNTTLTSLAGAMRRRAMSKEALRVALLADNKARCKPPLADEEVEKVAVSVGRYEPEDVPDPELARNEVEEDLTGVQPPEGPGLVHKAISTLHTHGLAGESHNAGLLYLAFCSRTRERPVNVYVNGPASGGKSELVKRVADLLPSGRLHRVTSMSPKALFYTTLDLRYRFLWVGEIEGLGDDDAFLSTIRALAWEGRLCHLTVDTSSAPPKELRLDKPGPTGLVLTGVGQTEDQLTTRMFVIEVNDTPAQSRQVVVAQAEHWDDPDNTEAYKPWHKLSLDQEQNTAKVYIPFKVWLSKRVPIEVTRIRRDFPQILRLIEVHTLLESKRRKQDAEGRFIAEIGDYAVVESLLRPYFTGIYRDGLTPGQRAAVEAVKKLTDDKGVTGRQVAKELGIEPSSASRRLSRPLKLGFVGNTETRKGFPGKFVLGDPLPTGTLGLPSPEEVVQECNLAGEWVDPVTGGLRRYLPEDDRNGATGDSGPSPVGSKPVAPPVAGAGGAGATPPATPESAAAAELEEAVAALQLSGREEPQPVIVDGDGFPLTLAGVGQRILAGELQPCFRDDCVEETLVTYVGEAPDPIPYCLRHARERASLDEAGR